MTLQEALDECTICGLFNKNVSDEHKFQVIDKIMSAPGTKVQKVKLGNIITWLLKKVEWKDQQIEKMKRCKICKHHRWNHCSYEINISADCIQNKMKHFELKEITENE